jgi:hypothetical protein
MTTVRPGTKVPARWRLFVCGLALLASSLVAANATGDVLAFYRTELGMTGQPAATKILTVAAGDTWGPTVGPDGDPSPFQLY